MNRQKIAVLDLFLELKSVSVVFHSNSPQRWRKDELAVLSNAKKKPFLLLFAKYYLVD